MNFLSTNTQLVPATAKVKRRRKLRFLRTRARELKMIGRHCSRPSTRSWSTSSPMRRCNLDCGYCNEYDQVSKPVPLEEMKLRLDYLAAMGTSIITISGGEPLLHPELEEIIRHIRKHGMIAGMITNGFCSAESALTASTMPASNISRSASITSAPTKFPKKFEDAGQPPGMAFAVRGFSSQHQLRARQWRKNPEDALSIAHHAIELGFSTVGIIHDGMGQLKALNDRQIQIFEEIMNLGKRSFSRFNEFQHNVARGKEHHWRYRSGSRYLYICEDGLVHWCSQQRGYPGIPLSKYTPEMRHREYFTDKFCGPRCTVSCVQQIGILDNWRDPQNLKPMPMSPPADLVQIGK